MHNTHGYKASPRERQMALSMLAHTVRHDTDAVTASLDIVTDPDERLRPTHVIATLLAEFQKGVEESTSDELAEWFAHEAQLLAARPTKPFRPR